MNAEILVLLANLGQPRRPSGARAQHTEPVLPDPATATRQLASLIDRPVTEADLPAVRRVQQVAVEMARAILGGTRPHCAALNQLVDGSTAHVELVSSAGSLHQRLVWHDPSIAAGLARRLIEELATLAPDRLRRCARAQCDLLFYDSTRSRTRRWHAEDPCGWRERQNRHRA